MPELSSLKAEITELFGRGQTLCLWLSGGSDSRLLLEVMLEVKEPFGILRFADGWSREQRKAFDAIIMANDLQVFTFPANAHVLVGEGDDFGMVSQYAIDGFGNTAMLVRDLVDDPKRCAFDIKLEKPKQKAAPVDWNIHIWGSRGADTHWLNGKKPLIDTPEWMTGTKQFVSPLADWSREDVIGALKIYGIDWQQPTDSEDLGNVNCCHNCLKTKEKVFCPKTGGEIDGVDWDKAGNTALIRGLLESEPCL